MKLHKKTAQELARHKRQLAKRRWLDSHEDGYHKSMGNRQLQMIAIGGSIGKHKPYFNPQSYRASYSVHR